MASANEADKKKPSNRAGSVDGKKLLSVIEGIEALMEEKRGIGSDISDVFAEAKDSGFDVKTLRKVITLRAKSPSQREEEEHLTDTYMHALGMLPLFDGEEEQSEVGVPARDSDGRLRPP